MSIWPEQCFTNLQVVVSGGTSGIGESIAVMFHEQGAKVHVTGATQSEAARFAQSHPGMQAQALDVRDNTAIEGYFESFERLDVLVNCAGIIRREAELQPEVFADVLDINLNGTMRMCSAARTSLAKSQGNILNTASMLSYFGGGLVPAYSASKGGVAQLTKSLAIAYAVDGIRVNAIAPGWINTPLTKALQEDPKRSEPILSRTPLGRWGEPEDLLGGVAYLASPLARFVTGVILPIDGGYLTM